MAASNAALVKACHSEQVVLADHTVLLPCTFTTNSGAPRKTLYRDALHPSPKGTMRLAFNVKYVGQLRPPLRPQNRPSHPSPSASGRVPLLETPDDDELMLNVLRCQLTYWGQVGTNAEARFSKSLRPRKPEGSLGRTAQDVHLDSHTAPAL